MSHADLIEPPSPTARHSSRPRNVLSLLERGCSYAEAAQSMGVAVSTVQAHVKSLYVKLGVHSKNEAVYEARQARLI